MDQYLEIIYVFNVNLLTTTADERFDPMEVLNRDSTKIATYNRYTTTEINLNEDSFKEAIKRNHYIEHECFINALYDFYKDNLLSAQEVLSALALREIRCYQLLVNLKTM